MEHGSARTVVSIPFNERELRVTAAAISDVVKMLESEGLVDQADIDFLIHVHVKITEKLLDIRKLNKRMYG